MFFEIFVRINGLCVKTAPDRLFDEPAGGFYNIKIFSLRHILTAYYIDIDFKRYALTLSPFYRLLALTSLPLKIRLTRGAFCARPRQGLYRKDIFRALVSFARMTAAMQTSACLVYNEYCSSREDHIADRFRLYSGPRTDRSAAQKFSHTYFYSGVQYYAESHSGRR